MPKLFEEHISQQMQIVQPDENEEEEDVFEAKRMISPGRLAGNVKKLQDPEIYTCSGLMMCTRKSLTEIKGLSLEAKADKMCAAADKIVCIRLLRQNTTGCQALAGLLGGGIATSAITEAFGKSRSGKTMLTDTLCILAQCTTGCKALDELIGGGIATSAITLTFGKSSPGKIKLPDTLCIFTQNLVGIQGLQGLSPEALDTLCGAVVKILKNTTGTTYNPNPLDLDDHLRLARDQGVTGATDNTDGNVGAEEGVLITLANLFLEEEEGGNDDDDDYVNRVGDVIPIVEFQNADWENTWDVENNFNLGDLQGEVDLDTCYSWGDLVGRVHDVYAEQTGNGQINGLNSANCWPGKLVQFCIGSGYPGLNQLK